MKILVTGGAGFIGTNLIKRLVQDGHTVVSLDNYDSGTRNNHVNHTSIEYVEGDIELLSSDFGQLHANVDVCFHLAALSRIQPSFTNPTETFRVNVKGTEVVCEWARKHNIKVIYAGSSSRWHDPHQSPYALYKFLGEEICKAYRTIYGTHTEIARFYNVYGPHEIVDGDWAAVIGIWRRRVRDNLRLPIVGNGRQRRDFTHVEDIVDGLVRIMENTTWTHPITNTKWHMDAWELGSGVNYSILDVYGMFFDKFKVGCHFVPDQKGNYRQTVRMNNDALDYLGWKPQRTLQEYINSL